MHPFADREPAADELPEMCDRLADVLHVAHLEPPRLAADHTVIADLTAFFGVERGTMEDDLGLVTRLYRRHARLAFDDSDDDAVRLQTGIADEFACACRGIRDRNDGSLRGRVGSRAGPLPFHVRFEARHIDGDAAFGRDLTRQLLSEAVRVVQR